MVRLKILLVVMLLATACTPVAAAQLAQELATPVPEVAQTEAPAAATATPPLPTPVPVDPRLDKLWFDMSMGSLLVDLFNQYAGPDDIARADHVSMVDLLDKVEAGRRLVVFKNVADAEMLVPRLADKMDIIGYNLEHGPSNRPDEQADPVGSARRVRTLADQYGMQVAFGPDRAFALSHGVQIAPYVDIFVLQVQRAQTEPRTVLDFVVPLVQQLRQANPDLQVSVQIRTEGSVEDLGDLLLQMDGVIDGVSILTNDETADVAKNLLHEIRMEPTLPQKADPAQLPLPTPTPTVPPAIVETQAAPMRRTALNTPMPGSAQGTSSSSLPMRSILLFSGLFIMGVIVTGVAATVLLYSVRNLRK